MIKTFIFYFIFFTSITLGQAIYEPSYYEQIYSFIDNQASKGNIKIFDAIRPYTRLSIAKNY